MDEATLWAKGAEARYAGVSQTKGLKDLGLSRYDHDERKAFIGGWVDMEKFLFLSRVTGTLTAVRVAPD